MGLRLSGLASGIDSSALIDALMQVERQPLLRSQQRKAELSGRQDLFMELGKRLTSLRDSAGAIDNLNSGLTGPGLSEEFLAYSATSSDEAVLTATASTSATLGTTEVTVEALASNARHVSTPFASESATVAAAGDTLELTRDGVAFLSITVQAPGASLQDLRDLINSDPASEDEVRASVLFDGTGHRLVVSGTKVGAASDFALATSVLPEAPAATFVDAGSSVAASDAQLEVMGVAVTRPSNSIVDLLPGLSLELRAAAPGTAVEVSVTRDDASIEEKVQDFVDAYNEVADFIDRNARYNAETGIAGPLSRDSSVRGIGLQLQRMITNRAEFVDNPFGSLSEIGVRMTAQGSLELDSEALEQALAEDASAVRAVFHGDGTTEGVIVGLARTIDSWVKTDPDAGYDALIDSRTDGFERQIKAFDQQIVRLEQRLEAREAMLVQRFTEMERLVGQLQSQGGALAGLFQPNFNR